MVKTLLANAQDSYHTMLNTDKAWLESGTVITVMCTEISQFTQRYSQLASSKLQCAYLTEHHQNDADSYFFKTTGPHICQRYSMTFNICLEHTLA